MTDDPWALCHLDDSFDASVLGTKGAQIQWFEDRDALIQFLLEDFVDLLADVKASLEDAIAQAVARPSTDDLNVKELKRKKLLLKEEIERVRQTMPGHTLH